jgi:membrane associated rhomboid family serine protease
VVAQQYTSLVVTIGASGAVFGILLAFGWLFPEVRMFILFLPIPIRARTFVIIYAFIELAAGFSHIQGDNVAHFAHLGGMLFGLLLIFWWNRDKFSWWKRLFGDRPEHTRLDSSKDKDYSNYHYQQRID